MDYNLSAADRRAADLSTPGMASRVDVSEGTFHHWLHPAGWRRTGLPAIAAQPMHHADRCARASMARAPRMIAIPPARKRLAATETPLHSPVKIPAALLVTIIMPINRGQPMTTPKPPMWEIPRP